MKYNKIESIPIRVAYWPSVSVSRRFELEHQYASCQEILILNNSQEVIVLYGEYALRVNVGDEIAYIFDSIKFYEDGENSNLDYLLEGHEIKSIICNLLLRNNFKLLDDCGSLENTESNYNLKIKVNHMQSVINRLEAKRADIARQAYLDFLEILAESKELSERVEEMISRYKIIQCDE